MARPSLHPVADLASELRSDSSFDALVVVGPLDAAKSLPVVGEIAGRFAAIDADAAGRPTVHLADGLPGNRLVLAPVASIARDHDDVRRFADSANAGLGRAKAAGSKRPLIVVTGRPNLARYQRSTEASLLGALASLWQPLEGREARGEDVLEPVEAMGFHATDGGDAEAIARAVDALEAGRYLARDICGTDPERMRPEAMAAACLQSFEGTPVRVHVQDDPEAIRQRYPLMHAVARASLQVHRHRPCVIRLEYEGEGPIEKTLLFAGKGLTYDTGGADLKVNGVMAGMSRDKGGAAAVAGFVRTVGQLRPRGVRVIAEIGAVRNSIGAEAFVPDEIITSHAGARCRIGNTDAEGRLVLADLLSHLREDAAQATNPMLFSVATLTGHSYKAMGPYSIALDNGPAFEAGVSKRLGEVGDLWGDPFEVSRLRREDWDFVKPRSAADDVLSCNNAPSSATARGHQFPMAFLCVASGLDKHGNDSDLPLPYTHVDIGGSACEGADWQHGKPTATPVVAFAAAFLDD